MVDDIDDNDDDFDKPDPKSKLDDVKADKDDEAFKDEDKEADELEDDVDVVIEEDEPKGDKREGKGRDSNFKSHSEEGRFGKRRNRHKHRNSAELRQVQELLNRERQRNDSLEERVKAVESNTSRIDGTTIDSQISESQRYYDQAKQAHAEAVKDGDGPRASEAMDLMMEARDTLRDLQHAKGHKAAQSDRARTDIPKAKEAPHKVDPTVISKFSRWHADNQWFDPGMRDQFSRIAYNVDNTLMAEGYDPRTDEYWRELTIRLKQNPTLVREVFEGDDDYDDNEDEEKMEKKSNQRSASNENRPNRKASVNDRSGNSGGQRKKIVVSRERAEAMRELGLQPGTSEWKKMAKKYENYDKQHSA